MFCAPAVAISNTAARRLWLDRRIALDSGRAVGRRRTQQTQPEGRSTLRVSRYFLPVLKESPVGRADRQPQADAARRAGPPDRRRDLRLAADRLPRAQQDRADRPRGAGPRRRDRDADADHPVGRPVASRAAATTPTARKCCASATATSARCCYGPTNEEMLTAIVRDDVKSYRDLPRTLYHIQWKFRDEVRPRFGVMRGREFLMKDAYSVRPRRSGRAAQLLHAAAGLSAHLPADGHPGGADEGRVGPDRRRPQPRIHRPCPDRRERSVLRCRVRGDSTGTSEHLDYDDEAGLHGLFEQVSSTYAATDETHDEARWAELPEDRRRTGRGIEVGHIFYFGDKYRTRWASRCRARTAAGDPDDGQLRHWRLAPGRRDHRGQP